MHCHNWKGGYGDISSLDEEGRHFVYLFIANVIVVVEGNMGHLQPTPLNITSLSICRISTPSQYPPFDTQ